MKEMAFTIIYVSIAFLIYCVIVKFDKKGRIDKFFDKLIPTYKDDKF